MKWKKWIKWIQFEVKWIYMEVKWIKCPLKWIKIEVKFIFWKSIYFMIMSCDLYYSSITVIGLGFLFSLGVRREYIMH